VARVESLNVAIARTLPTYDGLTGIDKKPVAGAVLVRAPGGGKGTGSGLVGDAVCDGRHHGGDTQAVYAYGREDLDAWAVELGMPLHSGVFGENLTTAGIDISAARLGERWRVGDELVLQVTAPRIPCRTFALWLAQTGWVQTFTARGIPGTYFSVVTPGEVRAGDQITVVHRPEHRVTVALTFRALTTSPELLPQVLTAGPDLIPELQATATRRIHPT
jgi:MOSC domain-containing protein YiiM